MWENFKMDWIKHSIKILEALATPILLIDRNYLIIGANSAACRSFCLSTPNIVGRKCFEITHQLDRPCWHEGTGCPARTALELKEQTRIIHEHIYGGKSVFEEIIASPIFDDNGEADFVVEELNNITELIQSKEIAGHLKKDIKILEGLLPICSNCKDIRDEEGYWNQIESYISSHTEVEFSHSLCEKCSEELYGQEKWYIKMKKKRESKDK
jgi:PAS domain S-box-containing protein